MASTVYERSSSQGDDVELHQFPQHQEPIIVDKINRNRNLNPKKGLNTLPTLPSPHEDSIDDINLPVKHKNPLHKGLISYTACEERQVIKKLDRHLVLFLALLYMLSFLDRSNIGNARIAGLASDLQLTSSQYAWLLTAFYITYILFEWMVMLYRIIPAHMYISVCVLCWGLVASLQSVAGSLAFLLVLRALLGICEAAFGPGVPFYLSFFFRRDELAFRTGLFVSAAPLASSFASSLAWLITRLSMNGPIASWRLLFLLEGFPSVVIAVFAWIWIPDSPGSADFLDHHQKLIATARLQDDSDNKDGYTDDEYKEKGVTSDESIVVFKEAFSILLEPKCYLTALMFFCCNVAFSSMPVFLPTVINDMGYSPITSQALTAPPYLFSFLMVLFIAKLSDKHRSRGLYVCISAVSAASGYAMLSISGAARWPNITRYVFIFPTCAGFFSAITIIITWNLNNQKSDSKKGKALAIMNVIGQCGPLIGAQLYPRSDGPYYVRGMAICAGFMCGVFALAFALKIVLNKENKRLRKVQQDSGDSGEVAEPLVSKNMLAGLPDKFVYYT